MTGPLIVAPGESGIVRLFALSDPLAHRLGDGDLGPLASALGLDRLEADHVQIVDLSRLDPVGLSGLLEQGHGIAAETLAADTVHLAGLGGTVAILRSRAFPPGGATLRPGDDCRLVATLAEEGAPPPRLEPLVSDGARGNADATPAPDEVPGHRTERRTLQIGLAAAAVVLILAIVLGWPAP